MKYINFKSLNEEKLKAKERNELPDSEFGIPSLRKFPLHDKNHVLQSLRMYHHCPPGYEEELARNIFKKMKQYGIPKEAVGKNNKLYKYIHLY